MRKFLILGLVCLFLCGCATMNNYSNLMYSEPIVQVNKDPDVKFSDYRTFATMPLAGTEFGKDVDRIVEKQLLFVVRNWLEYEGYDYIKDIKEADFTVAISFKQEYKTVEIPPRMISLPIFNAGWTSTSYINGSRGYIGSVSTYNPGYWTYQPYTIPGETIGSFYPIIAMHIFDKKSGNSAWEGIGTLRSDNHDIRLSSQMLISKIISQFPSVDYDKKCIEWKKLGFNFVIMTNNGNDFYPSIGIVWEKSPVSQKLKRYDIITKINGVDTLNKPLSEVRKIIEGIEDKTSLTIRRMKEEFVVEFQCFK